MCIAGYSITFSFKIYLSKQRKNSRKEIYSKCEEGIQGKGSGETISIISTIGLITEHRPNTENVRQVCEAQLEKVATSGWTLDYTRDQH